jgi:ribosome maturation factor RimP
MAQLAGEVLDRIEAVLSAMGVELVGAELTGPRRRRLLRLTIYRPSGVDLDLCEEVSEVVGSLLDEIDPIESSYVLEVSSPGLERNLNTRRDFERAVGESVRVVLEEGGIVEGVLEDAGPDGIRVHGEEGSIEIAYDEVKAARTVFEW